MVQRPERVEVDAERYPAQVGRPDPGELGRREVRRHDDLLGKRAQATVEHVRGGLQREPARHPGAQDRVEPLVGEEREGYPGPPGPPGQPADAELVAHLKDVGTEGVEQAQYLAAAVQDVVAAGAEQPRAAQHDPSSGRRLLVPADLSGNDQDALVAGRQVPLADRVDAGTQAARGRCVEVR